MGFGVRLERGMGKGVGARAAAHDLGVQAACRGLTPLRCSVAGPAAELASFTALRQAAASQSAVNEASSAAGPATGQRRGVRPRHAA